jgi:thioredoxin reductase
MAGTIQDPSLQDVVNSVNDAWYKALEIQQDVRQLELRVDQFVPTTVNMTVASKPLVIAAGVVGFALGCIVYRDYVRKQAEKSTPTTTEEHE